MNKNRYHTIFCLITLLLAMVLGVSACSGSSRNLPPGWMVVRPLDTVMAMAVDGDTLWAGGIHGVYKLDRQTGKIIEKLKTNPALDYVKALLVDKSGLLYIAHFNGLTTYDGVNFHTYTQKDGLPDNRVNALMLDNLGRLWVGTWGGAAVLEDGNWRIITQADGLIDNMVNLMLQDTTGGIWFGSAVAPHGGLSYLKDGKWQYFSTENGLPHNNINGLFQDSSGDVWAATGYLDRGGAIRFGQTSQGWAIRQILTQQDGLSGAKVRSVFQDKDGTIWFGSESDGMTRYSQGKMLILTTKDGLSAQETICMLQDVDGNLWMGTQNGITRLSPTALHAF